MRKSAASRLCDELRTFAFLSRHPFDRSLRSSLVRFDGAPLSRMRTMDTRYGNQRERPRERLIERGAAALTDVELVR